MRCNRDWGILRPANQGALHAGQPGMYSVLIKRAHQHSPLFVKHTSNTQQTMDHIVDQIINMAHGEISVIVNCMQMGCGGVPPRVGSRVVQASEESIIGLTLEPVHFFACTQCGAVSVALGHAGDIKSRMSLLPSDPRARLLSTIIIETENNGQWGRVMAAPARVVGMINVHGAAKVSETKYSSCFHCS